LRYLPLAKSTITALGLFCMQAMAADAFNESTHELISASLGQDKDRVEIDLLAHQKRLKDCGAHSPFLPYRVNPYGGRVTIGYTCADNEAKSSYLQVQVRVMTEYWQAAREIGQGELITADMLQVATGVRSGLPRNVVVQADQVVGQVARRNLRAGAVLQGNAFEAVRLVKRNDAVDVKAVGIGFTIKRTGQAMDNGALGDSVRVRLEGGDVISARVSGQRQLIIDI
jgi:flagellar basal body P-ring formation protein FlgA